MKTSYFPMFMDLQSKRVLIVGAGSIATRRAKVLNGFDTNITVLAPELTEELQALVNKGEIAHRSAFISNGKSNSYGIDIVDDYDIVLACTNDQELNHMIYLRCKEKNILVNNCSNKEECDFFFPGVVQKNNLVIGVNASGCDHVQAKEIREKIQEVL